jgi:hypothetical protein
VRAVAADSWALTLWTFYQSEEADYMRGLVREHEQLRMADMIATAYHEPKKLREREADWRRRATVQEPADGSLIEELSKQADDLWAQHERGRKRMVS